MRKVYHCYRCGKWFEHPRRQDEDGFRTLELCPKCGRRVYPLSKTFTLTRRETGLFKQPSYRVVKDGKSYYFSSVSGIASFIAEFIKPRSEDDLVTITVETTKLKEEHPSSLNGGYSRGAGI